MPPVEPAPKTPAQKAAAIAARRASRPMRDHPKKGTAKPAKKAGGIKNPAAVRTPGERPAARMAVDGLYRLSLLDPTETASEFILLTRLEG